MTEPSHAVFLSYASQDAGAAKRICQALRAAGVEVYPRENRGQTGRFRFRAIEVLSARGSIRTRHCSERPAPCDTERTRTTKPVVRATNSQFLGETSPLSPVFLS